MARDTPACLAMSSIVVPGSPLFSRDVAAASSRWSRAMSRLAAVAVPHRNDFFVTIQVCRPVPFVG